MFASAELQNYPSVHETVLKLGPEAPSLGSHIGPLIFRSTDSPFFGFLHSFNHFAEICDHLMSLAQVQALFHQVVATRYQAVLLDAFMCECFLPLAHLADAPVIQVAPSHLMPWNYDAIGSSVNYAQVKKGRLGILFFL